MNKTEQLIWIDIETTGFDPRSDKILEIAVIVTAPDLIVDDSKVFTSAIRKAKFQLKEMTEWSTKQHTESGLIAKCLDNATPVMTEVEAQILEFLSVHTEKGKCPIAGSSVWFDKAFLQYQMPSLYDWLHYRIIDVSSIMRFIRMYDELPPSKKLKPHTALADLQESIGEFREYRDSLFPNWAGGLSVPDLYPQSATAVAARYKREEEESWKKEHNFKKVFTGFFDAPPRGFKGIDLKDSEVHKEEEVVQDSSQTIFDIRTDRLLTTTMVCNKLEIVRSTLYNWMNDSRKEFPKPIDKAVLGNQWSEKTIDEWVMKMKGVNK
jgi:oligoribonuclease